MIHDVFLEGYGCRLRPVLMGDAAFIVGLRNQKFTLGTIHQTSDSVELQRDWIRCYNLRANDYYWIIEVLRCGMWESVGTVGLYDFWDKEAMPGRWVMYPQTDVSIMTPTFLLYDFAFERLSLNRLVFDVVATNRKVLKFHRLYGAREISAPKRYLETEVEVGASLRWFEVTAEMWHEIRKTWLPIVRDYAEEKNDCSLS